MAAHAEVDLEPNHHRPPPMIDIALIAVIVFGLWVWWHVTTDH